MTDWNSLTLDECARLSGKRKGSLVNLKYKYRYTNAEAVAHSVQRKFIKFECVDYHNFDVNLCAMWIMRSIR